MKKFKKRNNLDKVVFIDRDGVINVYLDGYIATWRDFKFIHGVKKAIGILKRNGFIINIVSNQAGVAKGLMTKKDLDNITKNMLKGLSAHGSDIINVYYCLHQKSDNCDCRKPKTGLFEEAIKDKDISLKNTFFIGDDQRDIIAGRSAGCKTILVLSGKTQKKDLKQLPVKPDFVSKNLLTAVGDIVLNGKPVKQA